MKEANISSSIYFLNINTMNSISNAFGYFLIPVISVIGLFLNLSITILLGKNKFKHKFYKYLGCKTVIDLIICINGIGFMNSFCSICQENVSNTLLVQIYKLHLVKNSLRVLLALSSLFEVFLSLNRYMTITNKKNIFTDIRTRILIPGLFLFSFLLLVPYLLWITIQKQGTEYIIIYNLSSKLAMVHSLIVLFFEFLFPIASVFFLNIIIHTSYQKRLKNRSVRPIRKVKFIKIVLILGVLFLIVRGCDFIVSIIKRLLTFFKMDSECSEYTESWINLVRQITFLMLYLSLSLNVIIYYLMDKNIRAVVKRYLNQVNY